MALSPISRTCQQTIDHWLRECKRKYDAQRERARQMERDFPGLGYGKQADWCKVASSVCRDLAIQNNRRRVTGRAKRGSTRQDRSS